MAKTATFDDLPEELVQEIFKYDAPDLTKYSESYVNEQFVWALYRRYIEPRIASKKFYAAARSAFWDRFTSKSEICVADLDGKSMQLLHGELGLRGIMHPKVLQHILHAEIHVDAFAVAMEQQCLMLLWARLEEIPNVTSVTVVVDNSESMMSHGFSDAFGRVLVDLEKRRGVYMKKEVQVFDIQGKNDV